VNSWYRKSLAIAAVLLLSVPSAVGVQRALEPTRGTVASWLAAAGFEAVYLAVALLVLTPELRRYAARVALSAVATAILLNSLADYAARVPGGLSSWLDAQRLFDPLALVLAVVESVPLAALAYAMATLLHRLAEAEAPAAPVADMPPPLSASPAYAREQEYPMPVLVTPDNGPHALPQDYQCPHCGSALATIGSYGAAKRWGHCPACKAE